LRLRELARGDRRLELIVARSLKGGVQLCWSDAEPLCNVAEKRLPRRCGRPLLRRRVRASDKRRASEHRSPDREIALEF
jgi:hypothetical protein